MIDIKFNKPPVPKAEVYKPQDKDAITREDLDRIFIDDEVNVKGNITWRKTLSPTLLCQLVCERFYPVTWNNTLYYYNVKTGLYVEDKSVIAGWIQSVLKAAYLCTEEVTDEITNKKFITMVYNLPKNQRYDTLVREVAGQVTRENVIGGNISPFNAYPGIPLGNCVLKISSDTNTLEAEPYQPSMMFTRKLVTDYNPDADVEPVISILRQWLPDTEEEDENHLPYIKENYEVLVQIPAQALYQGIPVYSIVKTNFYMIVGRKDAGKSAYGWALAGLFGEENVSGVFLQDLTIPCYLADLVNKYINYGDDLYIVGQKDFNCIRSLSGTDKHAINQKFKPVTMERISAVHVYSTNLPPEVANLSPTNEDAFWGRWMIIDFTEHFEEDTTWKSTYLTKEFYEGFLLLSIAYIRKIIENHGDIPIKQPWMDVKQRWTCDLSPFHQFVRENLIVTRDGSKHLLKEDLFECMNVWADKYFMKDEPGEDRIKKKALLPKTISELTKRLQAEGIYPKQIRLNEGGERKWVYKYVDYNPECHCKIRNGAWSNT